jgi:Type II secretory pathway, component PulF
MKLLKLSKVSWLILSAGVFIVVLGSLGIARSQQIQEKGTLDEELRISTNRLEGLQTSLGSRERLDALQQRIEEEQLLLDEARKRLDQTVVSVDVADELFAIADYCGIIITGASTTREHALHIFLGVFILIGMILIYVRTEDGKMKLDVLMLRLPQLGRVRLLNELSRCCRSISLLFTAGLPLTEIMPLVVQGANNRVIAQALYGVQVDMMKGEGLAKPMSRNPIFLPMMVQMVKVGEETGSLDTSLIAVAQNYESEAQEKTKSLINMIPPVMTIIIAGIVGLIALSMVSAMYSIYGQAF